MYNKIVALVIHKAKVFCGIKLGAMILILLDEQQPID